MPNKVDTRSGLYTFENWERGDDEWDPLMVENFLRLGRVGFHLSVIDRDLDTPPGSPSEGDTYIVAATATGAWEGHEDEIAFWGGAEWVFYEPRTGWTAVIEDEKVLAGFFTGDGWSAGAELDLVS